MSKPQQREIARSERGEVDEQARFISGEGKRVTDEKGRTGKVPPANRPGHHPEQEQDKPGK